MKTNLHLLPESRAALSPVDTGTVPVSAPMSAGAAGDHGLNPETSVIIPNWNGRSFLETCLSSLRAQTYRNFEVIVVDNGSTDDSVSFIGTSFPEVVIIRLPGNEGFSRAVNRGIQNAKGKYIALLNNDTEVHPAWLGELVKALESSPETGFCASKMLNYYRRNMIDNAGDGLKLYGYMTGKNEIDSGQYDRPRLLFSACAGAAIYRRELFDAVGLFDEDFFAYYEDIDLGMRAQLAGYRCLYVPTAIVYHIHQATSGRMPAMRFRLIQRNIVFVHLKNTPLRLLVRVLPALFFLHLYISGKYLAKTKDIKTVLLTYWQILIKTPAMLKKRRPVQKMVKVPLSYIESVTGPFPSLPGLLLNLYKKSGNSRPA